METWILHWSSLQPLERNNVLTVPETGAVYRLSYRSSDGNYYVFYVGQASNLRERLLSHFPELETNFCIGNKLQNFQCSFRYALVNNAQVRSGAEKALFQHFLPECNTQLPPGPDISINFE